MAALYTAIVRNLACVVRTLLPADHAINAIAFPSAPAPFNEVTAVEAVVATTQALAICFFLNMGIRDIWQGIQQWRRTNRLLAELDAISIGNHEFGSAEFTILRHSMQNEKSNSITKVFIGIAELVLFAGYFPLLANSLHLRGESHPKPVIDALLMMELFMVYLLWVMWKAFRGKASSSSRCRQLADCIHSQESGASPLSKQQVFALAVHRGYSTDLSELWTWMERSVDFTYKSGGELLNDLRAVHRVLHPPSPTAQDSSTRPSPASLSAGPHLRTLSSDLQLQSLLAAVSFLLNLIAWYGYLQCIVAFYLPVVSHGEDWMGKVGRSVMLGMAARDAEFYGIFAGDLAWTLDPIWTLLQPALVALPTKMRAADKPAADRTVPSQKKDQ